MPDDQILVAELCGGELRVSRYHLQLAPSSCCSAAESNAGAALRRLKPHLLLWDHSDARGRELGRALSDGRWISLPSDTPRDGVVGIEVLGGDSRSLPQLLRSIAGALAAPQPLLSPGPEGAMDEQTCSRHQDAAQDSGSVAPSTSAPTMSEPATNNHDCASPGPEARGAGVCEMARRLDLLLTARTERARKAPKGAQPGTGEPAGYRDRAAPGAA